MKNTNTLNLKVLILDTDFYAQQAFSAVLGWDRRTRVIASVESTEQALAFIQSVTEAEWPDVILIEPEACATANDLAQTIMTLQEAVPNVIVMCLARHADPEYVAAAVNSGARAYLLRNELQLRLVWVICHALDHEFTVTESVPITHIAHKKIEVVMNPHDYAGMTDRIRQALWLCVICGMPASLAADEMAVSPHTVRSYIKTGYRILEANDENDYPDEMGPLERAFMRFTALSSDDLHHEEM